MVNINVQNTVHYVICIGTRSTLIYIAKTTPSYAVYLGLLYLIVSIRVFYMFLLGNIENSVDKKPVWFNNLRPIHGFIYFAFFYYSIQHTE